MKKFYAIALVAAAALTANAQNGAPLYATGGSGFDPEWAPSSPAEFTYADGVYTLEVQGLVTFKLSTAKSDVEGDWTGFNAGGLTVDGGYGSEFGVEKNLISHTDDLGGDINAPYKANVKITVSGDLKTIKLETNDPKPTDTKVYLRGDMNGWGVEEAWEMTQLAPNQYGFTCPEGVSVETGTMFKIADADWGTINYGVENKGDALDLDMEYVLYYNANDFTVAEEWSGTLYFTINDDNTATIEIKSEKEPLQGSVSGINVDDNAVAEYYNLQGVRVANPENGIFIVVKGGKAVKVVK